MTLPSEFFPTDFGPSGSTFAEFLQIWQDRLQLPEEKFKVLEGLIKDGLTLLKKASPSTSQISEVIIKGKKVKLCPAEKGIVPIVAKACHLDLAYAHGMFKRFVAAWDTNPIWKEMLIKPQPSINKRAMQEIANKFILFIQVEKFTLVPLLTHATLAQDDPDHPLQKPSHHIFTKFCTPALGDELLANLPSREVEHVHLILSCLVSLVSTKVPFSPQFKLGFAEWYFEHSQATSISSSLDAPGTRALMDALFLAILELDCLDYQCDLAPDIPHWTLTCPETTCSILELGLKVQINEKNRLVIKALSLLSTSLLETFEESSPNQAASLHTFLKQPASSSSNIPTECSVPEILTGRVKVYNWSDALTMINSASQKHVREAFASILVAVAVLDPKSVVGSIKSYLACVAAVYRSNAALCGMVWGSTPGSSQRAFLEFVQSSYPADPVQLPFLLKHLSTSCAPQVVHYLSGLPSLTVPNLKNATQAVRSSLVSGGRSLVENPHPMSIELPVFLDAMVPVFTIPKLTRGMHVPSLTESGSICWSLPCNAWDIFFKIFAALASKPIDTQSLLLVYPIVELLTELAVAQPQLIESAIGRGDEFVKTLIAVAQTAMPKAWEFQPRLFLLLAALLPLHPRMIASALVGWFSSPSFEATDKATFLRIFSLCSSYCVKQHMLSAFGYHDLAGLGEVALKYALNEFQSFFDTPDFGQLFRQELDFKDCAPDNADPCLEIISSYVRLAQSPSAPSWLVDLLGQEFSDRNKNYKYAHLFLKVISTAGPHLRSGLDLMTDVLLLMLTLAKDPRFGHFDLVRALLEHSNPQSPWALVSLFKLVKPASSSLLAHSAAKAIGLLLTAAEDAKLGCLAGHVPDNHRLYGAGLLRLLRAPSTTPALQKRLWYVLAILSTCQQELMSQFFPEPAELADLVLQRITEWDAIACKTPIACFLAAVWRSRWRASAVKPLLSSRLWELLVRHFWSGSANAEDCAASVYLLELVGHELTQSANDGWDPSFFKVVKAMADPQVLAPVFLGGLLPCPKPQGLDQLFSLFSNSQAYILPLQGTLVGDLCSNSSGLIYDLSAATSDLSPQLAKCMAAADLGFYRDQVTGKLLMAWQRSVLLLFKQPENHWADRGGSYAKTLAELIQGLIKSVEPIARQIQPISSSGSLGLGSLLGSLLAHAVKHPQPKLAGFVANHCAILTLCMRWSFRQQVACPQQHKIALAQASAWYQVMGRSMQLLAQEATAYNFNAVFILLEEELHFLLGGNFADDKESLHEPLGVLLESLLIILDVPRLALKSKGRRTAVCLANFLLSERLPPILAYQVVLMLLRSASSSAGFVGALPKERLLIDFPRLFPLPALSEDSGNGLLYFTHSAFLRLAGLFKPCLAPEYLSALSNMVCSIVDGARITPPQMCLLRTATLLLTSGGNLAVYHNLMNALPSMLVRLLTDTGVETVSSAGHLMQLAQEHVVGECDFPVEYWEGELVYCILGCFQRMDHSGDLALALSLNVSKELTFGLLIGVIRVYYDSEHPLAEKILQATLGLLTSQFLLLVSASRLDPLSQRHIAYDIQQELQPYQPPHMSTGLSTSWRGLASLLANPNLITPY